MDWTMVWTIVGINAGLFTTFLGVFISLFLWSRSEIRSEISEIRKDTNNQIQEMRLEFKQFRELWAKESKEFHGRLCSIEEKRKKVGE